MRKFEKCTNFEHATLPTRADHGSAGYDFYNLEPFAILPGETMLIKTGIKAQMPTNEVLLLYIRSSVGIKRQCVLANGTGVIDSTYYNNPDNEGNICLAITNVGRTVQTFDKGERLMQGVFVQYMTVDDDKPLSETRLGGIGSSGQ